jgi:hypothetical protein
MELGEVGAETIATIAVEEEAVIYSGTELIVTIKEDHVDIETLEKIARKTTQEVLSIRIILRIF